jgi:hypothetical protein
MTASKPAVSTGDRTAGPLHPVHDQLHRNPDALPIDLPIAHRMEQRPHVSP